MSTMTFLGMGFSPPFAATLLQPLGAPLVLVLAAALAFYGYRSGLFLATVTGLHALAAVVAALGLKAPVGSWLELADVPRQYALPGAFLGVLAITASVRLLRADATRSRAAAGSGARAGEPVLAAVT
jgi:hypothetical protein